jgi:hypothetical protein
MSERESTIRAALVTYFPMFIATLSLVTSIYNGYLNNKFVNIIRGNVGRVEYLRTCKEIIDAYFQVKFRAGVLNASGERGMAGGGGSPELREAENAVAKFGALGTYLANLRDDETRAYYTQLTNELDKVVREARRTPPGELDKLFAEADRMFADMNNDCVARAKEAPL